VDLSLEDPIVGGRRRCDPSRALDDRPLPHRLAAPEATITGSRSMTGGSMIRSLPSALSRAPERSDRAGDLDQLLDQRIPEMSARPTPRNRPSDAARIARGGADPVEPGLEPRRQRVARVGAPDQRADDAESSGGFRRRAAAG